MAETVHLDDHERRALKERYRLERDKRIRSDGNDQYREIVDELSFLSVDHYATPTPREPIARDVEVVVIGGGYGGLLVGARLKSAGISDVVIIERGGELGGTWYWNRYPGAQCDIESYVYMPLLEEIGFVPSERYVRAPEILRHAQSIASHFALDEAALTSTSVIEARYDTQRGRWLVATDRGDQLRARFLVSATGPLQRPKLPATPGIEVFKGVSFHTSRWNYDYTGGDSLGGLDRLGDKSVAVIGTGATAIQVVPHLARAAKELFVFQRTPSSVDARNNRPTDLEWFSSLEPGWQQHRVENFNAMLSGVPVSEDLVNDGWTQLIHEVVDAYKSGRASQLGDSLESVLDEVNLEHMERLRRHIDEVVDNESVAEALKPYYGLFCKRPCFNDDYLASFNLDNVTLVDTDGQGVSEITPTGVIANGVHYEVDCIIYATGFEVGTDYERRAAVRLVGVDGRSLSERWEDAGIRTLHGMHVNGFPNLFIVSQFQAGWTANYTHLLDEAARHITYLVTEMNSDDRWAIEATRDAEEAWASEIVENARSSTGGIGGTDCTPGYYNNEGHELDGPPYGAFYGKGSIAFFDLTRAWREDGTFAGTQFLAKPTAAR